MKIKRLAGLFLLTAQIALFTACSGEQKKTPNSEMNDVTKSGTDESTTPMGLGEGDQDKEGGYPANQGNLYADSTRRDTTKIR